MRKIRIAVLLALALSLFTGCGSVQQEHELFDLLLKGNLSEQNPQVENLQEKNLQVQNSQRQNSQDRNVILLTHSATGLSTTQKIAGQFKMLLEERSAGAFQVELFPDDTLGHVDDSDKPLVNGTVEMRIGAAVSETTSVVLWAPTLTGISLDRMDALLQGGEIRRMIEEECEARGTKLLAVFPAHYRVLTSNESIESAVDFSKLRIRIFSSNSTEGPYWQSLGAETRQYDIHQVYSALQQGLVNSQENTLPLIVSNSIHKQQKYLIHTNHKLYYDCMLVGKEFYDSLSEEEQELLRETAEAMVDYAREADERELKLSAQALKESGVETVELPDDLLWQMRERGGPVVEAALRETLGDEKMDRLLEILR